MNILAGTGSYEVVKKADFMCEGVRSLKGHLKLGGRRVDLKTFK